MGLREKNPVIVAIGASAGGVTALKSFFSHVDPDWPFCYVVIQHLSSDHKSQMKDILEKTTTLPIEQVSKMSVLKNAHIYLIPPGKLINLSPEGKLEIQVRPDKPDINKAIDFFFLTLGNVYKERAIGVILSGTGSDGVDGIKNIKENGGFVIVQDPSQAEFDGMPLHAIDTVTPDDILPVEEIPERIFEHYDSVITNGAWFNSISERAVFDQILKFLSEKENIDLTKYKEGTLYRRIRRQMDLAQVSGFEEYFYHLKASPSESEKLIDEFFIGVTEFFRDPETWEVLRSLGLSGMIKKKVEDRAMMKIWCIGCCTGEEVYSLAMLIREELEHLNAELEVKIFATDIKKDYITRASLGSYSIEAMHQLPAKYRDRYFDQRGDTYKIRREIRDMIIFSRHNLVRDTPFHKLDLITCRNVLIYLKRETQRQVLRTFEFSLRVGGMLFMGNSENIGKYTDTLENLDKKSRLFKKSKPTVGSRSETLFDMESYQKSRSFQPSFPERHSLETRMFRWTSETLAQELGVVGMYIDENFNILHAFGNLANYASFPHQGFTTNLLKLLKDDLMHSVQICVRKASRSNEPIVYQNIRCQTAGGQQLISLTVKPVNERSTGFDTYYFLILRPVDLPSDKIEVVKQEHITADSFQNVIALEEELKYTREHLQTTIQELEFSNEELQATNEELISANEELQSTNEELQSLNEELHTVNAEHREKIEQLAAVNADMDNLMESTKIGTIFLDRKLRIRKFTPAITAQFNILHGDIGRPITHFTNNLGDRTSELLQKDIHEVIITGKTKQSEVITNDEEWYIQRITPFINSRSVTDGVVISFINITELKNAELELRKTDEKFRAVVEGTQAFVTIIDLKGKVLYSNNVLDVYNLDTFIGSNLMDWMDKELRDKVRQVIAEVITSKKPVIYENKHLDPSQTPYYFLNVASPILENGRITAISIISNDVSEIKKLQTTLEKQNRELANRAKELEQFAFISSHDLQEPLKTVRNFAQLITQKYSQQLDEVGNRSLRFMNEATDRMSSLINGLLEYSQLNRVHQLAEVDCKQVMANVISEITPEIDRHKAKIDIGDLPVISGYASNIFLLFKHLLKNGIKFHKPDTVPHIKVNAVSKSDHWEFSFQDNGIGINPEYHNQIFGIFQRLHKKDTYTGTGIGLAYCRKIVELHGGKIWVESSPNQGSTFRFTVPH